ncbi:hypothetical protein JZK55_10760 [Dissulfurispira thermophila]|uniref:Ribbon-helix-helix protein CopG domain-containing protein n=2 Tax=root TaxID=1 RepID=A0A7G1H0B7_9BACT|nr:ribbon-helix-helix domain-containing protein [Dissulfurispira thermophila]BCB96154.1 hypothetical protein JZK55_10760 [Dissulfurispira thermophila]
MPNQMLIRIEEKSKERLTKLARLEGKTTSQLIRELIDRYLEEHDMGPYVDNLWERIGKKMRAKGFRQSDIKKAIEESRRRHP